MGSIQAEKPFAIANAKPNQRWLCYFEVTIKEHGGFVVCHYLSNKSSGIAGI
jgi:hypothetical protein